jgi:ABC-type amino acid transport substrate-binding protein
MNLKLITRRLAASRGDYWGRLVIGLMLCGLMPALWADDVDPIAVIRIGVENNSPPLSFKDGEGKAQGFTSELLIEMEKTGLVRFEIVPSYWSFILKRFNEGKLDALANVIETEERRNTMSYSIPHVSLHGVSYTRPDDARITHASQFAGKSIAMIMGTMSYLNAMKNNG